MRVRQVVDGQEGRMCDPRGDLWGLCLQTNATLRCQEVHRFLISGPETGFSHVWAFILDKKEPNETNEDQAGSLVAFICRGVFLLFLLQVKTCWKATVWLCESLKGECKTRCRLKDEHYNYIALDLLYFKGLLILSLHNYQFLKCGRLINSRFLSKGLCSFFVT